MYRETKTPPQPRLILFTPVIGETDDFASLLASVCGTADVAAVILRTGLARDEQIIGSTQNILSVVQKSGAALLLEGHPKLAAEAGADGAHMTGIEAFQLALPVLKPGRIAGAGELTTRHEAMTAGEAGADYVMFGEPDATGKRPAFDAIVERVAWWAEIFEVPCVGFAANFDEVAKFVGANADFIALGDAIWSAPEGPALAAGKIALRIQTERVG